VNITDVSVRLDTRNQNVYSFYNVIHDAYVYMHRVSSHLMSEPLTEYYKLHIQSTLDARTQHNIQRV
jgi:hypothetical protein